MFDAGSPQVTQELCNMFIDHGARSFYLDHQLVFNKQISVKIAEQGSILVEHLQRMLLLHVESLFSQTMSQGILIDFLQMSVPMVAVNSKSCFANYIAKLHDLLHRSPSFLRVLRFFVADANIEFFYS